MAEPLHLCRPVLLVAWHTLMTKSGLAESLARRGVSVLQQLAPVYRGGPIAQPAVPFLKIGQQLAFTLRISYTLPGLIR
jgi:hypothetical protein